MSLVTYQETRPWARAIKARVADHTMPPGTSTRPSASRNSRTIDRSATPKSRPSRWVDAGAPQGDPQAMPAPRTWPEDQGWNFAKLFGQKEPDMIIKSHSFTMPAQSQDAWDKRMTPSGLTEPRWVRAIEIRPVTVKGRKITHHAIALQQDEPEAPSSNGLPSFFMEWAVGKQGELMRPDTGKLLLPGSVRLGHPLLASRRDHQPGRDGPLLLPEGRGVEDGRRSRSRRPRSARWTSVRTP